MAVNTGMLAMKFSWLMGNALSSFVCGVWRISNTASRY